MSVLFDDRDLELRTLRDELAAQEATVREARRLTDNVRYLWALCH